MKRSLLLSVVGALVMNALLVPQAFPQVQNDRPKLPVKTWTKPSPPELSMETLRELSPTVSLPLWIYNTLSARDDNFYGGLMVGEDAFNPGSGATKVTTQVVPIVIITNRLGTSVDSNGMISTTPGVRRFSPTSADKACMTAPNDVPLTVFQQSPIFNSARFNFGGTDVGVTQYVDAFQRANFWQTIDRQKYHVLLDPVEMLAPIVINVPAKSGLALEASVFGSCGPLGIVDINLFDSIISNQVLPALNSKGVRANTLPIFLLYNLVLSIGDPKNLNNCCVLGYHGANNYGPKGIQTYSPADFDTTGLFGTGALDTAVLAHEVGEWMNDPYGFNATPPWGHTGQVGACQNNLEVGDPLTGTLAPSIFMPNGYTYHLQELAFFSWFFGAPSVGLHGWFSNDASFLTDAGPVCH